MAELIATDKAVPSESGHWYAKDGSPCYTVKSAKGEDRPTTLRDARKLNLLPSVTTITKILDKPGLASWLIDQTLWAALTLTRNAGESDDGFIARIKTDSKERGRKAAERGTALHTDIERFIQGKPHGHEEHCKAVEKAMFACGLDIMKGTAEHSFAHPDGFAGKIDWRCGHVVCDFKSKDKIEEGKRLAWDEMVIQLAAYSHGIGITAPRCLNFFVGIDDCKVVAVEHSADEIRRGMQMFGHLLQLWQIKNSYQSTAVANPKAARAAGLLQEAAK